MKDFEDQESGIEHPWRTITSGAPPLLDAAAPLVKRKKCDLNLVEVRNESEGEAGGVCKIDEQRELCACVVGFLITVFIIVLFSTLPLLTFLKT